MASISYSFIWSERRPSVWQRSRAHGLNWTLRKSKNNSEAAHSGILFHGHPLFLHASVMCLGRKGSCFLTWPPCEVRLEQSSCATYHRGPLGLDFTTHGMGAKHAREQKESIQVNLSDSTAGGTAASLQQHRCDTHFRYALVNFFHSDSASIVDQ